MGSNIVTGIAGRRYEEQCFSREYIAGIHYQKGCALEITLGGRGDDGKRRKISELSHEYDRPPYDFKW